MDDVKVHTETRITYWANDGDGQGGVPVFTEARFTMHHCRADPVHLELRWLYPDDSPVIRPVVMHHRDWYALLLALSQTTAPITTEDWSLERRTTHQKLVLRGREIALDGHRSAALVAVLRAALDA